MNTLPLLFTSLPTSRPHTAMSTSPLLSCPPHTQLAVLCSVEAVFEAIACIQAAVFFRILLKVRLIHVHLRVAVMAMCWVTMARVVPRTIVIRNIFNCNNTLSNDAHRVLLWFSSGFNVSIMVLEVAIIVERTLSHILAKHYERYQSKIIMFFLSFGPVILGIGITFNTVYLHTISLMPVNYVMLGLILVSGLVLLLTAKYFKYRDSRLFRPHTLSERYQRAENLLTNKTMLYWCVYSITHRMLAGGVQIYRGFVRVNVNSTPDEMAFAENLLHLICAIMMNFFPLVFILTLRSVRQKYRETFPTVTEFCESTYARITPRPAQEVGSLQAHFHNLQDLWNVSFATTHLPDN